MKKYFLSFVFAAVTVFCVLACGCAKSDSPMVGKYYLVTVTADNGSGAKTYSADGSNPLVTKNSFTLELKDNYRWDMLIVLPGINEAEDGKWEENNGVCVLKEDKDDPEITLNYNDGTVTFNITEDGYNMVATLSKK